MNEQPHTWRKPRAGMTWIGKLLNISTSALIDADDFEALHVERLEDDERESMRHHLQDSIQNLKSGEHELRLMRQSLQALLLPGRACVVCGAGIAGRSDRRYCGATCRQRAHRRRPLTM